MASDFEKAVSEARAGQIATRAIARARSSRMFGRRVVALAGGMITLILSMVAFGSMVTQALPGDPLYGLSSVYEEIGTRIGFVDPVQRRLDEVIALVERGDTTLAAQAAQEALVELEATRGIKVVLPSATPSDSEDEPTGSQAAGSQAGVNEASGSEGNDSEAAGDAAPAVAEAAETPHDVSESLKLAAQMLAANLDAEGEELGDAAAGLAWAAFLVPEEPVTEAATTTTTTTLPESTTSSSTTTSSTTTTIPEDTTTTIGSTTTTTTEGDGSGDDGDKGPIFLPPSP